MASLHRVIISGGGTGGHIFPAISIANALRLIEPAIDILFVGALGRMEMEKVPQAGYRIIGLPISGFMRKLSMGNVSLLFKLISSLRQSSDIIRKFKPDAVVGVGGYASGAVLFIASRKKIPCLIQEQNSYPGITNRLLSKKAGKICVAYEGMEKYFPADKIILNGNPVRQDLENAENNKNEALKYFNLKPGKKTLLIIGGSLGARTINQSIIKNIARLTVSNIQILWQTGKTYYKDALSEVMIHKPENLFLHDFINRMDLAYSVADVVISRAGACAISELSLVGKACILVPSPNVAEDHQTKNAMVLVKKNAALLIPDNEACDKLVDVAMDLIRDEKKLNELSANIKKMAYKNSAIRIAEEVLTMVNQFKS
jgi:UDP-N-acetylglucosamine--N-acetylmuramyl-(pentapeptide) pyrophosphoryl-undecaprenol N-acetylglucosamine transferase